jgi:hypothetical protein
MQARSSWQADEDIHAADNRPSLAGQVSDQQVEEMRHDSVGASPIGDSIAGIAHEISPFLPWKG